ncbi:MAG: hypothetical protein JXL80_02730 [Planctomycetes bacterium]|nr:hypothetical protein [Planctomycetota bacterium]
MPAEALQLDARLARLRRRWILRDALRTTGWSLALFVPMTLALAWLDWRLDFSPALRSAELAGLVAGGVWIFRRFAIAALRQSRDSEAIALRAEAADPRFAGRLVSRVEFRRTGLRRAAGSIALMEAMCARVEAQAAGAPLDRAVDLRAVRLPAVNAGILLILLAVIVTVRPAHTRIWLHRTLLPLADVPWPRRTHLLDIQSHYRIRRGDVFQLTGRTIGEIPRTARVNWWPADQTGLQLRPAGGQSVDVQPDGRFTLRIGPLLQSIRLAVQAGDASVNDIEVDTVVPPSLAAIRAVYHYPAYTNRSPDEVQSGDIRAIVGTRVELTLTADRPAERMELAFPDQPDRPAEPIALPSEIVGRVSVDVDRRCRYQIAMFDRYGFTTETPATFVIDPIDNELPDVKLTRPGSELQVTPATRLTLRFNAADDFGVTGAAVRWFVRTEAAEPLDAATTAPADFERTLPIPVGRPRTEWAGAFAWDLAAAGLQPGDTVEYVLEVRDAGLHLTPDKVGRTPSHVLRVVATDSLELALEARLRDTFAELDHLIVDQRAARDQIQLAAVALPVPDEPLMPADLRRIQAEQHRQKRLARLAERVVERLAELADEMQDSFIGEPARHEQLRALAAGLRQLAAQPMQAAADSISRARDALDDLATQDTQTEP